MPNILTVAAATADKALHAVRTLSIYTAMAITGCCDTLVTATFLAALAFKPFRSVQWSSLFSLSDFLTRSTLDIAVLGSLKGATIYVLYARRRHPSRIPLVCMNATMTIACTAKICFVSTGHAPAASIIVCGMGLAVAGLQTGAYEYLKSRLRNRMSKYLLSREASFVKGHSRTNSRDGVIRPRSLQREASLVKPLVKSSSSASENELDSRHSSITIEEESLLYGNNQGQDDSEYETPKEVMMLREEETLIVRRDKDGKPMVIGGTLERLIELLTDETSQDPQYVKAFLLTYRSFCEPVNLLDGLIERYKSPVSVQSVEDPKTWRKHVRVRIWYVLKIWLENAWEDVWESEVVKTKLVEFVSKDGLMGRKTPGPAAQLEALVNLKASGLNPARTVIVRWANIPRPLIPTHAEARPIMIEDIPEIEFVRQLTVFEHAIFQRITPLQCIKRPNDSALMTLVNRFNRTNAWIITTILSHEDIAARAVSLEYFITVATECKKSVNFNGMMEVLSALQSAPISRLTKTWDRISRRAKKDFEEYTNLLDGNFRIVRQLQDQATPPCLPYIGLTLSDLTFIEENADVLRNNLINFEKRYMTAAVITKIQQNQQKAYSYASIPDVQMFIERMVDGVLGEKEAYQQSLLREPRGS